VTTAWSRGWRRSWVRGEGRGVGRACRARAAADAPLHPPATGPYDASLPTPASALTWFVVDQAAGGALAPRALRVDAVGGPADAGDAGVRAALVAVAAAAVGEADVVDLHSLWRPFFARTPDGAPVGPALTKGEKLRASVGRHLAPGAAREALLDAVLAAAGGQQGGGAGGL